MIEAGWSDRRLARQLSRRSHLCCEEVLGQVDREKSFMKTRFRSPLDGTVVEKTATLYEIGATDEETGLQRNGTGSSLPTNPYSISAVIRIVFVCGDPVVKRVNPAFALQQYIAPTAGVMVWGDIAYNICSPPKGHFSTKQGSASLGKSVIRLLCNVTTLPWPAQSPDLSPIEHISDHFRWRVEHPTSLNEQEARLQKIWNEMAQDIIQNLYASMLDRIASCIHAKRDSTGY
ncbi:transposable element Tcb1 transposase [Trichonephila clavipes]|nr:transposable element Tcb1 transposase [Trichonephila clavipes]